MGGTKGTTPEEYAGVYQRYEDIPPHHRLETFAGQYSGKDTWETFVEEYVRSELDLADRAADAAVRKVGPAWRDHVEQRGRHHALAMPADVDEWCQWLLDGRTRRTAYEQYFVRVYQFYEFLKSDYRHPHLYNPCLLAAIEFETTRHLWMYRVESRPEADEHE